MDIMTAQIVYLKIETISKIQSGTCYNVVEEIISPKREIVTSQNYYAVYNEKPKKSLKNENVNVFQNF